MKKFFKRIRKRMECTWIWDKLFLDFYFDKRWTVRFRLLNFLSGGVLLYDVVGAWRDLKHAYEYENDPEVGEETKIGYLKLNSKHAKRALDSAMKYWTRGE